MDCKANKNQIKEAVEVLFNVHVSSIKTLIRKGKVKRVGSKMKLKTRPNVKKAFVTISEGKIDVIPKA